MIVDFMFVRALDGGRRVGRVRGRQEEIDKMKAKYGVSGKEGDSKGDKASKA